MTVIDLKSLLDLGYFNLKSIKGIADEYRTDSFFANNGFSPATRFQKMRQTISRKSQGSKVLMHGLADGVVMGTYLEQSFRDHEHDTVEHIREVTVMAGKRRVRTCLMTTATTILALLSILTSTGRGSDVMVPMAIPSFGGMTIEILTMLGTALKR